MEDRPSRLTQTDILLDPGELEIDKSLCPSELMSSLFKYPSKHHRERGRCYLGWILAAPHGARCSRHDDLRNSRSRFTTRRATRMPHAWPYIKELISSPPSLERSQGSRSTISGNGASTWDSWVQDNKMAKWDHISPIRLNGRVGSSFRKLQPGHRCFFLVGGMYAGVFVNMPDIHVEEEEILEVVIEEKFLDVCIPKFAEMLQIDNFNIFV